MHTEQLKIIGCGGHSKVVIDALTLNTHSFQLSLCDANKDLIGKELAGLLIEDQQESLTDYSGLVHIAIGSNQARKNIMAALNPQIALFTVIHPAAVLSSSAQIESGSFIAARAVIGPEAQVGRNCIINHGAVVDHEVRIGACSHIAPNSTLGGRVHIGRGVLVGSGAVILPGIHVGDGAIIAAGAVVIRNVTEHTLVKGVPAV